MLNPLELYLVQLAESLKSLPEQERKTEIQEVRHHLECLVAMSVENGKSVEEAMQVAIRHFGSPTENGIDLTRAWRRGRNRAYWKSVKKHAFILVGTREGKPVIHWPGVVVCSILILAVSSLSAIAMLFVLGRSFFLLPGTLLISNLMILFCIFIPGIRRGLRTSSDQLIALD